MKPQELLADVCSVCSTKPSGSRGSQTSLGSTDGLLGSWQLLSNSLIHRVLEATLQRENTTSLQSLGVLLRNITSPQSCYGAGTSSLPMASTDQSEED